MQSNSRALVSTDIPEVTAWLGRLPLYDRYGFTGDIARTALGSALRSSDLLLVRDSPGLGSVGLAWCLWRGAFGRSPYLRLLAVREDASGQGHGGRLLQEVEGQLANPGATSDELAGTRPVCSELFLLVSDFNTAAQRFYQRHGYQQVGRLNDYVLPGVAELLYYKPLLARSR